MTNGIATIGLNKFLRSGYVKYNSFDIREHLPNFKPSSVDPEQLFSLARISKTHLQAGMLLETLSRNVFLSKNTPLFQGTQTKTRI